MKQLTCEMCGSTDLTKQDGVFVCQTCGCKYSVEEAKKMMVEGTVDVTGSTVKVDVSEKVKNLYVLARRARDDNNAELAEKYYEMITFEMPNDWEALFYLNYFKAKHTKLKNMDNSVIRLTNSLDSVFDLIYNDDKSIDEKYSIAGEVIKSIDTLCDLFIIWAKSHYKEFSNLRNSASDLKNRTCAVGDLQRKMAYLLEKYFSDKFKKEIVFYLKSYIENYMLFDIMSEPYREFILKYHFEKLIEAENHIKELDPEYKFRINKSNGQINSIESSAKGNDKPMTKQAKIIWVVTLSLIGIEIVVGMTLMWTGYLDNLDSVNSDLGVIILLGLVLILPFITTLIGGIAAKISTAKTEKQNKEEKNNEIGGK